MKPAARHRDDYSPRQIEAARRVLVDMGQVLAAFEDCVVIIGGWVPDLLLANAEEPHIGSIDVDIALDVKKLGGDRYASMLQMLLHTGRYRAGAQPFQFIVDVDLADGGKSLEVELEFLAPKEARIARHRPKLLKGFRVLLADGCSSAFHAPERVELPGMMVNGAHNTVGVRVASVPDFLIMKAHAIAGRDKPKDTYDFCYCLQHFSDMAKLAMNWRSRMDAKDVRRAAEILREKFAAVDAFGPIQMVEFFGSPDPEARAMDARRAYELAQKFLGLL